MNVLRVVGGSTDVENFSAKRRSSRVKEKRTGSKTVRGREKKGVCVACERARTMEMLARKEWSIVARGYPGTMEGINTGCRRHLRR